MTDDEILDAEVRAAARVKKIIGGGVRELTIETVRECLALSQVHAAQVDALSVLIDAFIEKDGFGYTYSRVWKALHADMFEQRAPAATQPMEQS
ncbi:hypothetical protein [Caballeronia sordidicola]|uniref:Uncharacterized protein n=1 Tax=Caballeronia sordidicola TaxID=196367 RepID=A0A242N749_CABSO|nr:hypothetical protein [Caballeronia sordidicola]OTP79471.1 hypothetical protein PAMC26577_00990 [Caballeronia sordidicola]